MPPLDEVPLGAELHVGSVGKEPCAPPRRHTGVWEAALAGPLKHQPSLLWIEGDGGSIAQGLAGEGRRRRRRRGRRGRGEGRGRESHQRKLKGLYLLGCPGDLCVFHHCQGHLVACPGDKGLAIRKDERLHSS